MSKILVEIGSDAVESDEWVESEFAPAFQAALDAAFPEHEVYLSVQRNISPLFSVTVGGDDDPRPITDLAREVFTEVYSSLRRY